jgi:hypothetical protein
MITYLIADQYKAIKEQTGIEDELAAAILTAAHHLGADFTCENGATMAEALFEIADRLKALGDIAEVLRYGSIKDANE